MILSTRANKEIVNITVNGNDVSGVTSHKFLGVTMDEILKLDVHINEICTKVSQ